MEENSKKRNRTIMTSRQVRILNKYFNINCFPSTPVREELGKILNMKPRTVQVWFQNQRQKQKHKLEIEDINDKRVDPLQILAELATGIIDNENERKHQK